MPTPNYYKVPKKKWSKWNDASKDVFNLCFRFLLDNQSNLKHPDAPMLPDEQWETFAWNAAWIAADACNHSVPDKIAEQPNIN